VVDGGDGELPPGEVEVVHPGSAVVDVATT